MSFGANLSSASSSASGEIRRQPTSLNRVPISSLSDREIEVFCELGRGKSTKQVAQRICQSQHSPGVLCAHQRETCFARYQRPYLRSCAVGGTRGPRKLILGYPSRRRIRENFANWSAVTAPDALSLDRDADSDWFSFMSLTDHALRITLSPLSQSNETAMDDLKETPGSLSALGSL